VPLLLLLVVVVQLAARNKWVLQLSLG